MRRQKRDGLELAALVVMFLMAIALMACVPTAPTPPPDGGTTVVLSCVGSSCNAGDGGNGASPSPGTGSGSLPPGSFVRVGLFGQSCPAGTTAPNNGSRDIKQGCTGFLTATPKDSNSNDLSPAVHGPNCTWSVTSGSSLNLTDAGNPFNRDARCASMGETTVAAQVKDVTGSVGLTCVQGAAARASSSRERVYFWTALATERLKAEAMAREATRLQ